MKPIIVFALSSFCLITLTYCNAPNHTHYEEPKQTAKAGAETATPEVKIKKPYAEAKAEVQAARIKYSQLYTKASDAEKSEVITEAGRYLDSAVCTILFPYWKGTAWDFNGHTDVPNEGEIACGYLVSTLLKHSGINVNRYKLAQQSSLNEIKTLAGRNGAKFLGANSEAALAKIEELKDGLYILGLSNHVGFIRVKADEIRFIHSTYLEPTAAINEAAEDSDAFKYSNVYYIGGISNNAELVKKWLANTPIEVVLD